MGEQAYKQRDAALAELDAMKKVLAKRCGEQEAQVAGGKAKLAARRAAATSEAARVKTKQALAKKEAKSANLAMQSALQAAKRKRALELELSKAKLKLTNAQQKAKLLGK